MSQSHNTVQQGAENNSADASKKWSSPWWDNDARLVSIFTGLLVGVGVLQFCAMKRQGHYMKDTLGEAKNANIVAKESADAAIKAAKTAEQTLKITERADVLVERIYSSTPHLFSGDTKLNFILKNFGRSRAIEVTCISWLSTSKIEDLRNPGATVKWSPPVSISPGAVYTMTCGVRDDLSDENIQKIASGAETAYFAFEVKYLDIFKTKYSSRHAGHLDLRTNSFAIDKTEENSA